MISRRALPLAVLLAALLSCDSPTGSGPEPTQVLPVSGTPQTGITEDPLAQELVVQVNDQRGQAMPGVAVAWAVDAGGGTLSAASSTTDAAGQARVQWTLGNTAGSFTARATVQGLAAAFTATAVWPQPAQVQVLSGNGQDGAPARALADSLAVKVVSDKGRPVPQVTVTWAVVAGGGTLVINTATTNAQGIARAAWTLGTPGPQAATATVGALPPATFAAFAVPVASVTLSASTVRVGRGDETQLTATPRDSTGAPLAGRTVAWTTSSAATATVSDSGRVAGRAYGTATITATSEGKSAGAQVTVTTEDRTAPRLAGFSFSPQQVDVTAAARTVEFLVHATDGGSGTEFIAVGFQGPSPELGASCQGPVTGNAVLVSGTAHDGVWKCTATLPRGARAGTWAFAQINLVDQAHNQSIYTRAQLLAAGFPTTLTVVNTAPPPAPPALTGLSFSPSPVNVGASDVPVEITFTATAEAGVREAYAFIGPTRGQAVGVVDRSCSATTRAGGTSTSGTWKCSITIPRHAPGGTWQVSTWVADSAGNITSYSPAQLASRGLPGSFQVVSPNEDVTAPSLTGVTLDPATVSVASGTAFVRVTLTATDAGTGVNHGTPGLAPPSGNGMGCSAEPVTGVPQQNATIICHIPIAAGAVEGNWSLSVYISDAVGNSSSYTSEQLRALGFPYEVTVTR